MARTVVCTTAKAPDGKVLGELPHGGEESVHGDKAHTSARRNLSAGDPAKEPIWCMPYKRTAGQKLPEWKRRINRGLFKNAHALKAKFALANLY